MTVYVDDMLLPATVGRTTSRWSHMFADTSEELIAFARKLRLSDAWIQYPGTYKEHYDLTETVRNKALRLGAVNLPIKSNAWVKLQNKKRAQFDRPLLSMKAEEEPTVEADEPTLF
jgi:hypothetical protein